MKRKNKYKVLLPYLTRKAKLCIKNITHFKAFHILWKAFLILKNMMVDLSKKEKLAIRKTNLSSPRWLGTYPNNIQPK